MRTKLLLAISCAALLAVSCGAPEEKQPGPAQQQQTGTAEPVKKPDQPVKLTVADVAGNLQLTQKAIEKFRDEHKDLVSSVEFTRSTAPELPGKIDAQQKAGRVEIDLVLTGTDALAAGASKNLWEKVGDNAKPVLGNYEDTLQEPAQRMQKIAEGQGIIVVYYPSGPLLEYNPAKVPAPPKTPDELLAWAKANPNKLMYARPANSGPGRTFLMGLPYLLGDSNPKDPKAGWDKTWAYLTELGKYIEYYPAGTSAVMKELSQGTRDMVASTTGWDINPRALGQVPKEMKTTALQGFHWVADAQYMVVPKGVSPEKRYVLYELMKYMLTKEAQAQTYDQGYFYPGPAVKDVPLSMAPAESQKAINEFGRPEYESLISGNPIETPLDATSMVAAFERWDREIGGSKVKK
ncbi:putative spermidine/putrescine transport system substrate-binding protein [Kibdelosporangium banguiense]|uniref:Spermidine/putrescine transport system substrate-binding protein n=1 Tax=Kibdelosporangium banguiense TaxID=1365924 RepID=A0ABS4TAX7_9PSEU|nr:extracellular solute-binding protein [Kibdelosporangium banguiense]MBP2321571.1 putative spermidine/putrescine transport system substrate-binding protein [Kibdelosporangium banguiense]